MFEPLTTDYIHHVLSNCKSARFLYQGTFPSDANVQIPACRPLIYVFNEDESTKPGSHWTLCYVSKDNTALFIDSTAGKPVKHLQIWLSQFKRVVCIKQRIQDWCSVLCGHYCIFFAHQLAAGKSLIKCLKQFRGRSLAENERFIKKWFFSHQNRCVATPLCKLETADP